MISYRCDLDVHPDTDATYTLSIWVMTNGTWKVNSPSGWCPSSGSWDASDLVGRGGCVLIGGGPKQPQILRFNEFKPYPYEQYKKGKVGEGIGIWINPMMPVGSAKQFDWVIADVNTDASNLYYDDTGSGDDGDDG